MTLQPWWQEMTHRMMHHIGDEAYQRHHFRVEVESNLRQLVSTTEAQSYAQTATLQRGFEQMSVTVSNLQDAITWSMETVAGAIEELNNTLFWGLAEIAWQQELTNELLRDVLKTLRHPRGTQAEELRERGNELYRNALDSRRAEDRSRWMDMALDAYREAGEFNPADFSVFHSMGVILFFEKGNSSDASRCFGEAAAIAEPYSKHHAAMSWTHLGYVRLNQKNTEEAYRATEEALSLEPEWDEACYQHAIHCALTGRMVEMKENLVRAYI